MTAAAAATPPQPFNGRVPVAGSGPVDRPGNGLMGLFDTILGRTKPVQSNLDALFALPSASITLQSASAMTCSGHAGVCFKPPSGQGFADMQSEVVALLGMEGAEGITSTTDSFGYQWLVVQDPDIEALVTQIHLVNSVAGRRRLGTPAALLGIRARPAPGSRTRG